MKLSPKERIEEISKYLEISIAEIAYACGYERAQAFYDVVNEKTKNISPKMASRIISTYLVINESWLLTGEGDMLKTEKETPDFQNANGSLYNIVPLWNFDAVGSMDKSNDITDSPAYIEKYIAFPSARKDDFCVHVTGNSMIPTYCPGSLVLLREVQNWREYFGYGHCFIMFLNDGRRILKEVQKFIENPKEYITCVSHNKEFPSEELPKSMIVSVYKVIATLNNEGF